MRLTRRAFGLGVGVGAAAAAPWTATARQAAPGDIRVAWPPREAYPIWPGHPPGAEGFRPAEAPADWSPVFLRGTATPTINVFRPTRRPNGRALLVCPGGAYLFVSIANEGLDVAARLNPAGITVFVLSYRLPNEGWQPRADVPLQDAQRAMRWIRANAAKFSIDPARLGVLGFSAGGHLAATLATDFAQPVYAPRDAVDRQSARPAFAALVYPLITMAQAFGHAFARQMLLGENPSPEQMAARSPELRVGADTSPCFLAHALDDATVAVENSLAMLGALRARKIPAEVHLFEKGDHAFGIGRADTTTTHWPELFLDWSARQSG